MSTGCVYIVYILYRNVVNKPCFDIVGSLTGLRVNLFSVQAYTQNGENLHVQYFVWASEQYHRAKLCDHDPL